MERATATAIFLHGEHCGFFLRLGDVSEERWSGSALRESPGGQPLPPVGSFGESVGTMGTPVFVESSAGTRNWWRRVRDWDRDSGLRARPQVTSLLVAQTWVGSLAGFEKIRFGVPLMVPSAQNQAKLQTLAWDLSPQTESQSLGNGKGLILAEPPKNLGVLTIWCSVDQIGQIMWG